MTPSLVVAGEAPHHRTDDATIARRSPGIRRGTWLRPGGGSPRTQLLDAMAELSRESGWERVTTGRLYRHAGLSRRVFEAHFSSIEECFEEAVSASLDHLLAAVSTAVGTAGPEWPDRVGAAVVAFLRFLDREPARAWMSIVEPLGGGDRTRFARGVALDRLGALIADAPTDAIESDRPRPRTSLDVAGGLWEMARQYLWDGPAAVDLDDVAGSTVFLAVAPYLGRREALRYATALPRIAAVAEPDAARTVAADGGADGDADAPWSAPASSAPVPSGNPSEGDGQASDAGPDWQPVTALAAETLSYLYDHPGAAGVDVSDAVCVGHPSQTSRHLRRLEDLDLVWSRREGRYKRWTLTDRGRAVVERLREH